MCVYYVKNKSLYPTFVFKKYVKSLTYFKEEKFFPLKKNKNKKKKLNL